MTRFTRHGHAVRLHGDPFATCVDEIAAMMVFNALCALETVENRRKAIEAPRDRQCVPEIPAQQSEYEPVFVSPGPGVVPHAKRREQDEQVCSCGLRWSVDEPDPHQ